MSVVEEILELPSVASFLRADLHIHSYGGSHDVTDATMTPEGIVEAALAEGLHLIAITDHNATANTAAVLEAAKQASLRLTPEVELSTPEGHLLAYFRNAEGRFISQSLVYPSVRIASVSRDQLLAASPRRNLPTTLRHLGWDI